MKEIFLNHTMNFITNNQDNITDEEKERLAYGLEGIYLNVTKLLILNLLAFVLGIWITFIISLILFNILRFFGFGVHANSSKSCFISSSLLIVGIPLFLTKVMLPDYIVVILCLCSIVLFIIYAPADTVKRPLTNRKKRIIRKIAASILALIYSLIIILITNLRLYFLSALLIETIMILPITYKLLGVPYNNYKKV